MTCLLISDCSLESLYFRSNVMVPFLIFRSLAFSPLKEMHFLQYGSLFRVPIYLESVLPQIGQVNVLHFSIFLAFLFMF